MNRAKSEDNGDYVHRLSHPRQVRPGAPFVGNETSDDNLCESAQVAAWIAAGGRGKALRVASVNGRITLEGSVDSAQRAIHCEAAVRAVRGVKDVKNSLTWEAKEDQLDGPLPGSEPRRAGHVTHFCQLNTASVVAAIRSSMPPLRELLGPRGLEHGFVVYRNRQPEAITVEVGFPLPADTVPRSHHGLVVEGPMPSGPYLSSALADGEIETLLAAHDALCNRARELEREPEPYFWQELIPTSQGLMPARNVHLPVTGSPPPK